MNALLPQKHKYQFRSNRLIGQNNAHFYLILSTYLYVRWLNFQRSGAGTSPGLVLDHQVVQTLTQPIFFIKAQMITDAEYFATPQDSVNHRWASHKSTANSKLPTAISSILPFNTLWHACQYTAHLIKKTDIWVWIKPLMLSSRPYRPPTASKAVLTSGKFRGSGSVNFRLPKWQRRSIPT